MNHYIEFKIHPNLEFENFLTKTNWYSISLVFQKVVFFVQKFLMHLLSPRWLSWLIYEHYFLGSFGEINAVVINVNTMILSNCLNDYCKRIRRGEYYIKGYLNLGLWDAFLFIVPQVFLLYLFSYSEKR